VDDQTVMANDKEDMRYMVKKLMEKYKKWELTLNIQKTNVLERKQKNLIMKGNKEVRTCKEYKYLRITLNREGTDD